MSHKNRREGKPTAVGWDGMVWFARINPGHIELEDLGFNSWGPAFATTFDNEEDAHSYADKVDELLKVMTNGNTPEKIPDALKELFNENGDFAVRRYDPYFLDERYQEFHNKLFTESGGCQPNVRELVEDFITSKPVLFLNPDCDLYRYYSARNLSMITGGAYPAIWLWKH